MLESRQLTPTLTDNQLIRKISRHFGREIQLAVVTRGIVTIPNFESLIIEYTQIQPRSNRESNYVTANEGRNSYKESESGSNKTSGAQKKAWGDRPAVNTQQHRTGDRRAVNTMEFTNTAAGTSGAEPKRVRQQEEEKKNPFTH